MKAPVSIIPVLAVLLLCSCGPAANYDQAAPQFAAEAPSAPAAAEAARPAANAAVPPAGLQCKIVYTADVNLVVENFDPIPDKLSSLLQQFGAVIAHSNVVGSLGMPRTGEWTIRVPVDRYNDLLTAVRQLGEIRSVQSDSRDMTEEYYDVEARIRNKRQEEDRMLKLLDNATGNLKDVLEIERELSRVREEVERMEGRLRVLNDLTSLSTVKLRVEEVKGYVPEQAPTYATRVHRAFDGSVGALVTTAQSLSVGIVAFAPWAVVLLVVGSPLLLVRRLLRQKGPDGP